MPPSRAQYLPGTPREPCLAAVNARLFREGMQELFGTEALESAEATLDADVRDEFRNTATLPWLRLSTVTQVGDALARVAGRTPDAVWDALVKHGAQRWFRLVWRVLLNLASDEALLSRSAMIYSRARNTGSMSGGVVSPGRAELVVTGWPEMPERQVRNLALASELILEAAGRRDVHTRYERTPDGAKLAIAYRPR